ncbi:hypothetical protein RMATCC62417_14919 [Rhizopus microsporus]|nr:hypothetical protein RMATCC62417_14919 [Rhizopus microsporus]
MLTGEENNVNLTVPLNGLSNYGQVISAAYETVATAYNNYYIENYEQFITNYFIYIIRLNFRELPMGKIKNLLFDHILDKVFLRDITQIPITEAMFPDNIDSIPRLQRLVGESILQIRNRLPTLPISRAVVTEHPFQILPVLKYILQFYEQNRGQPLQQQGQPLQQQEHQELPQQ